VLIAGRVVQGAGAAAAQPASLGLLLAATPVRERATHAARWSGAGALGIALGPVIGGGLTTAASWRWAFLVNLPIVAVAGTLTPRVLGETVRHPGRSLPDPLGALMLALAAASCSLGISQLTTWGAGDPRTAAGLVGGAALAAAFARRCAVVEDPVLDLALLRERRFALVTVTTIFYAAGFFGLLLSFVLFLTSAWGLTTVEAGLGITPMAVVVIGLSFRAGRLADRVGFAAPLAAGAAIMAVGLLIDAALQSGHAFRADWIAVAAFIGVGIGLCYLLLGAAAVAGLPPGELAAATAINQCARQLGAAFGVAATVAALGAGEQAPVSRFHVAWVLCAGFCAVAAAAASMLPRGGGVTAGEPRRPRGEQAGQRA
jgi:MFS family permease